MCQERSRKMFSHRCGCPVKLVQACLSASKDRESSFHSCRGPIKLVEACLSAGKIQESSSNHRGGLVKLFMRKERRRKQFSRLWRSYGALAGLFKCRQDPTK